MPSPSFHKLVLPSTLQAKKLRLPDDFVKQYGGNISSIVTLTVPDGSIWRVGLKKEDNKFWLLDGWHDFVQHYSIGIGYLLLFRYEGRSCFIVNIYSFGTSEINYESPAQSSNEAPHRAKHLAILEDVEDEDLNLGETGNTPSSKSAKSPDNQMTRDKGLQFNEIEFEKSTEEVKLRTATDEKVKRTRTKKRKSDVQERPSEHEDEVEMRNSYESASARKRTVTDEERKRARNEAEAFEPSNPFCRVILRPSYLYRGCIMYLPSCFAEKHLNGISDNIKLQISDGEKQWSVRCVYKDGKAKLSQGWFDFALENNLGEGDVCVFERLAAEEVVLHVTFFRITEDE